MKMTQCVCHWANYSPAITTYSDKYRFVMQPLCGIYPLITLINMTEHTTEKILKAYTKVDNKTKGCIRSISRGYQNKRMHQKKADQTMNRVLFRFYSHNLQTMW